MHAAHSVQDLQQQVASLTANNVALKEQLLQALSQLTAAQRADRADTAAAAAGGLICTPHLRAGQQQLGGYGTGPTQDWPCSHTAARCS